MPRLTNGTFEYTPNSSATDITLMPEWSLNLTQWFTTAPPSGETKLFRRLRVTRP